MLDPEEMFADLKFKLKIFVIGVDFILNFVYNRNMNSYFIAEVGPDSWIRYEVILQVKWSYASN